MTKLEIIDETVEYYSTHSRSVDEKLHCVYMDGDKRCGFSRCCTPEAVEILHKQYEGIPISDSWNVDDFLQEKYHGHSPSFWYSIQSLHDNSMYWEKGVLTYLGQQFVDELKNEYAN